MKYLFGNNVVASLTLGVAFSDTYLTVDNGAIFPTPDPGNTAFHLTLQGPGGGPLEICLCTARSANILTVQRGADGTSARGWVVGDTISMRVTHGILDDFYNANLPITGGNLQGRLFMPLDPTVQNEVATKNYVDGATSNVFATNAEIDSSSPPANKATSAAGLRSVVGGTLSTLTTVNKTGLVQSINEIKALVTGAVAGAVFWGTFDASAGTIAWNPGSGQSGNTLPPATPANAGHYLICSKPGSTPPGGAPAGAYLAGDWVISDGGSAWYHLATGTGGTIQAASVTVSPAVAGQTNVQNALQTIQANTANYLNLSGGVMLAGGNIGFTVPAAKATRLDGADLLLSVIDHFTIDAGVF